MKILIHFLKDEEGATAIEYALITALIGIAIVAALTGLGSSISNLFGNISTSLR